MEAFWVFPWLVWLAKLPQMDWAKPPLSLFSLALILGISHLSTKYFLDRKWSLRRVRLSILACAILTVFSIIRIEFSGNFGLLSGGWFVYIARLILNCFSRMEPLLVALILFAYLWWRGTKLGRSRLYANDVYRSFLVGVASLVLVILIGGVTSEAGFLFTFSSIWSQLAGFFFFGLMAMALANLRTVQQKISTEGVSPAPNRSWLFLLLLVIGGPVTIGAGVTSLVSAESFNFLDRILNTASTALLWVLFYLYLPIGYLLEGLYYIARYIVSLFHGELPEEVDRTGLTGILEVPEATEGIKLPIELLLAVKWLFLALIAAGIIFLLVKAISRYTFFRERDEIDEVHESLWSWDLFRDDLRLLLRKLQQRFESRRQLKVSPALPAWYLDSFLGILSVRQIYECLLWETSRINMARQYYETPNEYARRLGRTVPGSQELLDEITNLYITARYGDLEIQHGPAVHANDLWKSLRKLLSQPREKGI
jgi:hypothetical protein